MQNTSWSELSWDPNAPEVVAWREARLAEARRDPVRSRVEHLRSLVAGKNVLDVGVVEHDASNAESSKWLHRHLVEAAAKCKGVDVLADGVAELRALGFEVELRDITESPLEEQFEVIVAGELVEHLGAPQALFESAAKMLEPSGRFVLTTPNPYMIHRTWKYLRGRFPDSVDHALLLGPSNLAELGDRAGLELVAWRGISLKDLGGWRNRLASALRRLLATTLFTSEIACDSIIYEFAPSVSTDRSPFSSSGGEPR